MLCRFFDTFLRLCVVFLEPLTSRIIVFYAEYDPFTMDLLFYHAAARAKMRANKDPPAAGAAGGWGQLKIIAVPCRFYSPSSFITLS